jgi:hypothetical protein
MHNNAANFIVEKENVPRTLNFFEVRGSFMILFTGFVFSLIVLIVEKISFVVKMRKGKF